MFLFSNVPVGRDLLGNAEVSRKLTVTRIAVALTKLIIFTVYNLIFEEMLKFKDVFCPFCLKVTKESIVGERCF